MVTSSSGYFFNGYLRCFLFEDPSGDNNEGGVFIKLDLSGLYALGNVSAIFYKFTRNFFL